MTAVIMLTAQKGSEKTTACEAFAQQASASGLTVGGIVAPARWGPNAVKTGIDCVHLASGERRRLAVIEPDPLKRTVGHYCFDPAVMSWAVQCACVALGAPLDCVVVDEVGPLEVEHKPGFAPALRQISTSPAAIALLVVRPRLIPALRNVLRAHDPAALRPTSDNRDHMPSLLVELVRKQRENPSPSPSIRSC